MSVIVNKTVLIDDSDIDLFIQRRFLEVYNFSNQLIFFQSAGEALQWFGNLAEEAPEVIFLDLNMPDIDGFAFLDRFRQLSDHIRKKSRIVILTSSNNPKEKKTALASEGVIMFITKPLKKTDIDELKTLLQSPSPV